MILNNLTTVNFDFGKINHLSNESHANAFVEAFTSIIGTIAPYLFDFNVKEIAIETDGALNKEYCRLNFIEEKQQTEGALFRKIKYTYSIDTDSLLNNIEACAKCIYFSEGYEWHIMPVCLDDIINKFKLVVNTDPVVFSIVRRDDE